MNVIEMTAQTSPSMVDGWGCRLWCVKHIYNTPPDYKNSRCLILTSYFHPTFRRGKELNLVHPSFQMHEGFQSIPTGCTLTDRKLNVLFIIYRRMVKTGVWHFPIQSSPVVQQHCNARHGDDERSRRDLQSFNAVAIKFYVKVIQKLFIWLMEQ